MFLSKIKIRNYRLLNNAELNISKDTTIIVGKNNTAKTSCIKFIDKILSQEESFDYNDYPMIMRVRAQKLLEKLIRNEINYEEFCRRFPKPSIEFYIDYSTDGEDDLLGALSPFIIDVFEENNIAKIKAEYTIKANKEVLIDIFKEYINDIQELRNICDRKFRDLFELKVYAIDPKNEEYFQQKSKANLTELFPRYFIGAERTLGEDNQKNNTLPSVVSDYFKKDANKLDKGVADRINNLKETIKLANKTIQKENSDILGELVDDAVGFGYPNGEELQIGVNTKLDLESEIINKTELTYSPENIEDILPNTHNGLGYKNLIKMQIQLAQYAAELKEKSKACIPLLFIEEPESHMHPQMQQLFAKYLENFIQKRTDIPIQIILTTHSPHIANAEEFSKIRYAQKKKHRVIYKDLAKFEEKNKENLEFIRKYLTISRCDLFFADKVIFVEGASERLLIPDMIKKCEKLGLFDREKYKLSAQYYSLIEIGGAYAHKFIPFVEFLRIPCLILTDVDPLKGGKSSTVEAGETSSNSTIKWWCRKIKELNDKDKVSLDDIFSLTNEEKTIGKCHIEFQVKENSICAKSLEEAIMNVNREHYDKKEDAKEEDIEFKGRSKTDFALELIYNNFDYVVPKYIANGLVWLNNEKIFS